MKQAFNKGSGQFMNDLERINWIYDMIGFLFE